MITQQQALELLRKWEPLTFIPEYIPVYRAYTCADCAKEIRKAWHIHCLIGGYKREFHLCRNCGLKYGLT